MFNKNRNAPAAYYMRFDCGLLVTVLMLGLALTIYGHSHAHAEHKASIVLDKARIVLGPPTIKVHGAYFELSNATQAQIAIIGASSKDYGRVEMHRSKVEGGMAIMEPVDSLIVEAGRSLQFEPGGLHLMLIEPARIMASKEKIMLTLHLSDKRKVSVPFTVMSRMEMSPQTAGHDHSKHAH